MVQYAPIMVVGTPEAATTSTSAKPVLEVPVKANLFRFNLVDQNTAVSVVGPAHGLKVLAAGCSFGPDSISDLLVQAQPFDSEWIERIRFGLMVFDEHNVRELSAASRAAIQTEGDMDHPPFRIFDSATRTRSMVPAALGLVIVNLKTRRIIQIHNSYADLRRKGRGRIRAQGKPTRSLFHYELPEAWSIVP